MTPAPPPGRIETLNGVQLYFEIHGKAILCFFCMDSRGPARIGKR